MNFRPADFEIVALYVEHEIELNAAHPSNLWDQAQSITFCTDWQGGNPDPERQTQVKMLWSARSFYFHFECRYRELFIFEDSQPNGRRDHLWDRDVAEVFLQPDPSRPRNYKEFEISPNGMWVDLDIFPGDGPILRAACSGQFSWTRNGASGRLSLLFL